MEQKSTNRSQNEQLADAYYEKSVKIFANIQLLGKEAL